MGAVVLIQEFRVCCFSAKFTDFVGIEFGQGTRAADLPTLRGFDRDGLHAGKNAVDGCGDHDLIVIPRGSQDEITVTNIDVRGVFRCDFQRLDGLEIEWHG